MEAIDFSKMTVAQLVELQAQIKAQKTDMQTAEDKAKVAYVSTLNKMPELVELVKAIAGDGIRTISTEKSFNGKKYKVSIALVSDSKGGKIAPCAKEVASWALKNSEGKTEFFKSFKDACIFYGIKGTGNDKRAMAEAGYSTLNHVKNPITKEKVWIDSTWQAKEVDGEA